MTLVWRLGNLPELGHLAPAERRALLERVVSWWWYVWLIGQSLAVGFLTMLAGMWAVGAVMLHWMGMGIAASLLMQVTLVVVPVGMLVVAFGWYQMQLLRVRARMRLTIRELLAGQRLPVCFDCGYNLAGQASERCPECGARVVVALEPVEGEA